MEHACTGCTMYTMSCHVECNVCPSNTSMYPFDCEWKMKSKHRHSAGNDDCVFAQRYDNNKSRNVSHNSLSRYGVHWFVASIDDSRTTYYLVVCCMTAKHTRWCDRTIRDCDLNDCSFAFIIPPLPPRPSLRTLNWWLPLIHIPLFGLHFVLIMKWLQITIFHCNAPFEWSPRTTEEEKRERMRWILDGARSNEKLTT